MFEVRIYIETTLKGPCIKDGKYGAIVEFTRSDGEPVTREVYGKEEESTVNRTTLLAIKKALSILEHPCLVTIHMSCAFIANTIEGGREKNWYRQEWKTARGEGVKNKDLWQQYIEAAGQHQIGFALSKSNEYSQWLKEKMKEV